MNLWHNDSFFWGWQFFQKSLFIGRDEKSCLPSTEKKAAVDVDRQPNKKNVFLNSKINI